jgi:transposase
MDFTKVLGLDVSNIQTILSEIGFNANRWSSGKHFTSWLGLCPSNRITGEKVIRTGTRTVFRRAANAFLIATCTVLHSKRALDAYSRRLKNRLGAPKAITAAARKLPCIFYQMQKYGQEYIEKKFNIMKNFIRIEQ